MKTVVGFVVNKVVIGEVFSDNFSFFLLIIILQMLYTRLSSRAGMIG